MLQAKAAPPLLLVTRAGAAIDAEEMIHAMRDDAEAWTERPRVAPNHADDWGLVQIITLASGRVTRADTSR